MSHPVCAARSEQYHVGSLLQVPGARSLRNGRAWQGGARGARARVSSPAGKLGWPQGPSDQTARTPRRGKSVSRGLTSGAYCWRFSASRNLAAAPIDSYVRCASTLESTPHPWSSHREATCAQGRRGWTPLCRGGPAWQPRSPEWPGSWLAHIPP